MTSGQEDELLPGVMLVVQGCYRALAVWHAAVLLGTR